MTTILPSTLEGVFSVPRNVGYGTIGPRANFPMIFNQDYSVMYAINGSGYGDYSYGTIFSIRVSDGTINILKQLNNNTGTNNNNSSFTMIFSHDYTTLYGSLSNKGQDPSNNAIYPVGVIFSFNIITNQYTILQQLTNINNTNRIISPMVLSNDGNVLYGLTDNYVFQYNLQTGIYSPIFNGFINSYAYNKYINNGWNTRGKVYPMNANGTNHYDYNQITLNGNYLVGYCYKDYNAPTANQSFIYKIDLSNPDISNNGSVLYTFDGSNNTIYGINAISAPVLAADGKMYGFTLTGGLNNYGTFYSIDLSGNINVVYHFNSTTQGVKQLVIMWGYKGAWVYVSNDKRTFYSTDYKTSSIFSVDISGNFTLFTTNNYGYIGNECLTIDNQKPPNFYFINGDNNTFRKYQNSSSTVLSIKTYSTMRIPYGSFNTIGSPLVTTDNKKIYYITNNSLMSIDNYGNNLTFLRSFISDPVNNPGVSVNPVGLLYNSSNNYLYGITYGQYAQYNGGNRAYNNGSFYSYNLSTKTYTLIKDFYKPVQNYENCVSIVLNSTKKDIYGLNNQFFERTKLSRLWKYNIATNTYVSMIVFSGLYLSGITLTKDSSTIYSVYNNTILIIINTLTSTYTDNVYTFPSYLNVGTLTLSSDESTLYSICNNYIFSYQIGSKTITNLYNLNLYNYLSNAVSPLVLGGSKNNNHIFYGTIGVNGEYSYIHFDKLSDPGGYGWGVLYSYDVLLNKFTIEYNYGGTSLSGNNGYVYPEQGGIPVGSILYANKDTIITTTYGGGTYDLGAVVKVRIHYPEAPCFLEGTRILCLDEISNQMVYIPVQQIRKGMKVKTCKHGFVPVNMIGVSQIENEGSERIMNRLYRLKQSEYADLFDDLVITGCHSTLVDGLTNKQIQDTLLIFDMVFMTDEKYRLLACLDEKAQPYEKSGSFTIYHIALDHDDYFMNYGIYANGLLVESCSQRYLKELSGMKLIE